MSKHSTSKSSRSSRARKLGSAASVAILGLTSVVVVSNLPSSAAESQYTAFSTTGKNRNEYFFFDWNKLTDASGNPVVSDRTRFVRDANQAKSNPGPERMMVHTGDKAVYTEQDGLPRGMEVTVEVKSIGLFEEDKEGNIKYLERPDGFDESTLGFGASYDSGWSQIFQGDEDYQGKSYLPPTGSRWTLVNTRDNEQRKTLNPKGSSGWHRVDSTGSVELQLHVKATMNGHPTPANLFFFDAEENNADYNGPKGTGGEDLSVHTSSERGWKIIEDLYPSAARDRTQWTVRKEDKGNPNRGAGVGEKKQLYRGVKTGPSKKTSAPVMFSEGDSADGTTITTRIYAHTERGSRNGIAIGFMATTDSGDAPKSFDAPDAPSHILYDIDVDGAQDPKGMHIDNPNVWKAAAGVRLGENAAEPDHGYPDGTFVEDQEEDLKAGTAGADFPEIVQSELTREGSSYVANIRVDGVNLDEAGRLKLNEEGRPDTTVRAWLDFNNDAKFTHRNGSDLGEMAEGTPNLNPDGTYAGTYRLEWKDKKFTKPDEAGIRANAYALRVRVGSLEQNTEAGKASVSGNVYQSLTPTSVIRGGEVEDLLVPVRTLEAAEAVTADLPGKEQHSTDRGSGDTGLDPKAMFGLGAGTHPDSLELVPGRFVFDPLEYQNKTYQPENNPAADAPIGDAAGGAATPKLTVSGVGTYTLDQKTGAITFVPEEDFRGQAPKVTAVATLNQGARVAGSYTPSVVEPQLPDASARGELGRQVTALPPYQLDKDNPEAIDPSSVRIVGISGAGENGPHPEEDGKTLNVPGEGTWTVGPNGEFTFVPQVGFKGNPTPITYTAASPTGVPADKTATITVTYPEVLTKDATTVGDQGRRQRSTDSDDADDHGLRPAEMFPGVPLGGASFGLSAHKGDVEITPGADATLTVAGEGSYSVDKTGVVTFTPEPEFHGTASPVTVTVTTSTENNQLQFSATYTPTVQVVDVNLPSGTKTGQTAGRPIGVNPFVDEAGKPKGGFGTVDRDSLKLTGLRGAAPGAENSPAPSADGKQLKVPGEGTWAVGPNGEFTFTPEPGYQGNPTPVEFTGTNRDGVPASNPGMITVGYQPFVVKDAETVGRIGQTQLSTDDGPGDSGADMFAAVPTQNATFTMSAKRDDADLRSENGQPLVIQGVGTYEVLTGGVVQFTPVEGYQGTPPAVTVTVTTSPANGSLEYSARYQPRVIDTASPSTSVHGRGGEQIQITPPYDGSNVNPKSVTFVDGTKKRETPGGTWEIDGNGVFTFTPIEGFTGDPDPIPYRALTNQGMEALPNGTITVKYHYPRNATTVAAQGVTQHSDDTGAGDNGLRPVDMFDGAPRAGSTITLVDAQGNAAETLDALDAQGTKVGTYSLDNGTDTEVNDYGRVTFTPQPEYTGEPAVQPVTVRMMLSEKNGSTVLDATYTPQVTNSNVIVHPAQQLDQPAGKPVQLTPQYAPSALEPGQPGEPDAPAQSAELDPKTAVFDPSYGSFAGMSLTAEGKSLTVDGQGTWTIDATSGVVTFSPQSGFKGNPTVVYYTAKDVNGAPAQNKAPLTVTYAYPEPQPAATSGPQGTEQNVTPRSADDGAAEHPMFPGVPLTGATFRLLDAANGQASVPAYAAGAAAGDGGAGEPVGEYRIDAQTGALTFAPKPEFSGEVQPARVAVVTSANNGAIEYVTTYTPSVTDVTVELPSAAKAGEPGRPIVISSAAAPDPSEADLVFGPQVDLKTIRFTGAPTGWTISQNGKTISNDEVGEARVSDAGEFTFTPAKGKKVAPPAFNFTARNTNGVPAAQPGTVLFSYDYAVATPAHTTGPQGMAQNSGTDKTAAEMFPGVPFEGAELTLVGPDGMTGSAVTVESVGTYTLNDDHTVTFQPVPEFTGSARGVTVRVTPKGQGGITYEAAYTADVTAVDVVLPPGEATGPAGRPVQVTPPMEGVDLESLRFVADENNEAQSVGRSGRKLVVEGEGTWTVDKDTGAFTFTPKEGFAGQPTPVHYTATNSDGVPAKNPAELRVTLTYVSPAPASTIGNQGEPQTLDGWTMFPDAPRDGAKIRFINTDGDAVSELKVDGVGSYKVDKEGTITFTPLPAYVGTPPAARVRLTTGKADGQVVYDTTYQVEVTPLVLNLPDGTVEGTPGHPASFTPKFDESNPVDPSSLLLLTAGLPEGSEKKGDGSVEVPGQGTWAVKDGAIIFTPEPGFAGNPSPIGYTGLSAHGVPANKPALVTVTYPERTPQQASTVAPQNVVQHSTDKDANNGSEGQGKTPAEMFPGVPLEGATFQLVDFDGTLTDKVRTKAGTYEIAPGGVITFTPESSWWGTDTVGVQVTTSKDNGSLVYRSSYNTQVTVVGVVLPNDTVPGEPGKPAAFTPDFTQMDSKTDNGATIPAGPEVDPATIKFTDAPEGWKISADGKKISNDEVGTATVSDTGEFTFTPAKGKKVDPPAFAYTANNVNGVPAQKPGTIDFDYSFEALAAHDDASTGKQGVAQHSDPEKMFPNWPADATYGLRAQGAGTAGEPGTGDAITIPGQGTYTIDAQTGKVTFTPLPGFTGKPNPVTVTGTTAEGLTSEATYQPNVTSVDTVLPDASATGVPGQPSPKITPEYPEGVDKQSVTFTNGDTTLEVPGEGTWTVEDGAFVFTPEKGFTGSPTPVEYQAKEGDGTPVPVRGKISVTYPGVKAHDVVTSAEQGATQHTTLGELFPGMDLTGAKVELEGAGPVGRVVIGGVGSYSLGDDGEVIFTPDPSFHGTGTPVTVKLTSGNLEITATYRADATPHAPLVAELPSATGTGITGMSVSARPDYPAEVDVSTVTFLDGTTQKVVPGEGTWTISEDGTFTFTPIRGFKKNPTPVTYTAKDTNGTPAGGQCGCAAVSVEYHDVETKNAATVGKFGETQHSNDKGTGDNGLESSEMFEDLPADAQFAFEGGETELTDRTGTFTIDPNGVVTYQPAAGFTGKATTVTIVATLPGAVEGAEFTATYTPTVGAPTAAVTGVVWNDVDGDGEREDGEQPFAGVTVELVDAAGAVKATATTGANGAYDFAEVDYGLYTVRVVTPAGTVPTFDPDGVQASPNSAAVSVGEGGVTGQDFGYAAPASITQTVFIDADGDGQRGAEEKPFSGVTVQLLGGSGLEMASAVTDGDGRVNFAGIAPGSYTMRVVPPTGYQLTTLKQVEVTVQAAGEVEGDPIGLKPDIQTGKPGKPGGSSGSDGSSTGVIGGVIGGIIGGIGGLIAGYSGSSGSSVSELPGAPGSSKSEMPGAHDDGETSSDAAPGQAQQSSQPAQSSHGKAQGSKADKPAKPKGALANTGADVAGLAVGGLTLAGLGAWLIRKVRRRKDDEDTGPLGSGPSSTGSDV